MGLKKLLLVLGINHHYPMARVNPTSDIISRYIYEKYIVKTAEVKKEPVTDIRRIPKNFV